MDQEVVKWMEERKRGRGEEEKGSKRASVRARGRGGMGKENEEDEDMTRKRKYSTKKEFHSTAKCGLLCRLIICILCCLHIAGLFLTGVHCKARHSCGIQDGTRTKTLLHEPSQNTITRMSSITKPKRAREN